MFIESKWYPDGSSTETDKGYEWTPGIKCGTYIWKEWVCKSQKVPVWKPPNPDYIPTDPYDIDWCQAVGCWIMDYFPIELYVKRTEVRTATSGGPFLVDPYEPTIPPFIPIPEPGVSFTTLAIYVNGNSAPVISRVINREETIPGINAPLIIGPVT
jgi:hypothetical protein